MLTFRYANEDDCGVILQFIKALAEYEKMPDMDEWTTYRLTGETLKEMAK